MKALDLLKQELNTIKGHQIDAVIELLADGNTIPFIARYRKERTNGLDEVEIQNIAERHDYLLNLEKRKEDVIANIEEQGKLTEDLRQEIQAATVLQRVEDLYRPYKQKRQTLAGKAKKQGLEPLALLVYGQPDHLDLEAEAEKFLNEELETTDQVLAGVHEIIAEIVGDNPEYREWIRNFTFKNALILGEVKDETLDERKVYEMYYDFKSPINKIQDHQVLALNRAEKEDVLKVKVYCDEATIERYLSREIIHNPESPVNELIVAAYQDAYHRFIEPAIERELRNMLSEKAQAQAIEVFSENLRNLLLQSPLKEKVVLGFDPAFRTGCKLAVVDVQGNVLNTSVIFPHASSDAKAKQAKEDLYKLIKKYDVDLIAIGNGTASRESEHFVASLIREQGLSAAYIIVSEAGASVYSASEIARQEFPDLQVEMRSAISIARRVQDPLAELVKIDPKSVGVGQYQHDLPQKDLDAQLRFVVETVVNQVGVDVNTASAELLTYVSGLTKQTAQNLVDYRLEIGSFNDRKQIKKVKRFGPKTFEQAIGFLRVSEGKNILDKTAIHPESYAVAKQFMKDNDLKDSDLGTALIAEKLENVSVKDYAEAHEIGYETLKDIVEALIAPGRDIRESMDGPVLRQDVLSIEDLKQGMELTGTVRNVVDFGAFVDIGVGEDGLVHISQLASRFIKHPSDVVAVGDVVKVWIKDVDVQRGRIQLTMLQQKQ
ncbi:Tex family protein [Erysipelothrix urinaevulpis]|uniref:Tex family protein n=1 Tax=Erysipelothrix urinaevulpis TaxID=2683717 RepID=UPI00135BADA2|nr:Tex family protein [Erysipelothrix urinaevulpis]